MRYRLLAVDVDGTLLDDEHRLSKENELAIREAKENGVKVDVYKRQGI